MYVFVSIRKPLFQVTLAESTTFLSQLYTNSLDGNLKRFSTDAAFNHFLKTTYDPKRNIIYNRSKHIGVIQINRNYSVHFKTSFQAISLIIPRNSTDTTCQFNIVVKFSFTIKELIREGYAKTIYEDHNSNPINHLCITLIFKNTPLPNICYPKHLFQKTLRATLIKEEITDFIEVSKHFKVLLPEFLNRKTFRTSPVGTATYIGNSKVQLNNGKSFNHRT